MPKKFIIIMDVEQADISQNVAKHLNSLNLSWSHYLNNSWLINDKSDKINHIDLREGLSTILDPHEYFVAEIVGNAWAARGKRDGKFLNWLNTKFSIQVKQ